MAESMPEPLAPAPGSAAPEAWYTQSGTAAAGRLGVAVQRGLDDQEARTRLARSGPNLLREARPLSFWKVFLEEVREPMILLLLVTGVLYALWGKLSDALTICVIILLLVGAEVSNEYRAKKAIAALSQLAEPTTPVRRGGRAQEIPVEQVVPGDVLFLQAGRRVPADARLLESYSLAADEAPLTGESLSVEKEAAVILPPQTQLSDRRNLVFAGTTIMRGRGSALVVATGEGTNAVGDPVDVALLRGAREAGVDLEAVRDGAQRRDEFTFDTLRKRMAVVYQISETFHVVVKGAPETILARSTRQLVDHQEQELAQADREAAQGEAARLAARGLHVLALAEKRMPAARHVTQEEAESALTFVGFIGLLDAPRPEVKEAIAACRAAGVRPIMITGDHPLTARTIADQIGLDGKLGLLTGTELDALPAEALKDAVATVSVYARTTPEQKLRIVQVLQARGERVAVTGDGINDAPALAAADIGVAMGETGTDVAREAADMVLADDTFMNIVRAMQEGRVLFANLKKGGATTSPARWR